ncbi:MAG: ATP-binding protein, partial [Bradyrhizobium sp.]
SSPVDRNNIVAASAPIPRSIKPAPRNAAAATEINTVAAKSSQGAGIATSARLSAAKGSNIWMRIIMLAPSASTMSVTVLGDVDLTQMRGFFAKPQSVIAMSFSDDPMMGMSCDRFAGSAITTLETTSFVLRTASLR